MVLSENLGHTCLSRFRVDWSENDCRPPDGGAHNTLCATLVQASVAEPPEKAKASSPHPGSEREIGILLMAFAPLDLALIAEPERQWRTLLIFLLGGIVLFLSGVLGEMGVEDD